MKKIEIYNLSKDIQNIEFEKPIQRTITINPGQYAWIPKPATNVFAKTIHGGLIFPPSADGIFIMSSRTETNLTLKEGIFENKTDRTIYLILEKEKTYLAPSNQTINIKIPTDSIWYVMDPIKKNILGKTRTRDGDTVIVFDEDRLYSR